MKKINNKILFFIFTAYSFSGICQSKGHTYIKDIIVPEGSLQKIAALPAHINEASGLAITNSTNFWTHNDGGTPVLFCLDSTGKLTKTLHLNHKNNGWEDLATDIQGNLFLGSIGNNHNNRRDLKIYRIPNPDSIKIPLFNAEIIHFSFSDQYEFPPIPAKRNFDCDAFIIYNDSIYLFTKNRTTPFTGYTRIYKLPTSPGTHKAILTDSLYLGDGPMLNNWVTGADISPDGKILTLLGHSTIWVIKDFGNKNFSHGRIFRLHLNHYTHKAGIAFKSKSSLFIVDENELGLLGGNFYHLNLEKVLPQLK